MATKISRKLKKAEKAVAGAAKLLAKAEKKRDRIALREKARADRHQAKRAARGARPASATRVAVAKRAAARPAFTDTATVADLREAAKANEIAGYSRMTKSQLLEALA